MPVPSTGLHPTCCSGRTGNCHRRHFCSSRHIGSHSRSVCLRLSSSSTRRRRVASQGWLRRQGTGWKFQGGATTNSTCSEEFRKMATNKTSSGRILLLCEGGRGAEQLGALASLEVHVKTTQRHSATAFTFVYGLLIIIRIQCLLSVLHS